MMPPLPGEVGTEESVNQVQTLVGRESRPAVTGAGLHLELQGQIKFPVGGRQFV